MKAARIRLVLVALLFAGWLAYLAYLVLTLPRTAAGSPLVLSRAQLLISDLDVIADVPRLDGDVTVEEVLWPDTEAMRQLIGKKLKVANLGDCRPLRDAEGGEPPLDWSGSGRYLLPLRRLTTPEGSDYQVAPTPPSPGYPPSAVRHSGPPRIYPATPEALAQYRQVHKP
jgi:hypothetical protein